MPSLLNQITALAGSLPQFITTNHILVGTGLLVLLLNLKGIPGMWHIRLFKGLLTQLYFTKTVQAEEDGLVPSILDKQGQPRPRLFAFFVTTSGTPAIDCDYNLHKSNSTFFSDLDINRTQLLIALFKTVLSPSHVDRSRRKNPLRVALGGASCIFRREIKPFQRYELWSRVLAWDEKWLYVASYFVKKGKGKKAATSDKKSADGSIPGPESDVLASCIARYVFKDGRVTVRPAVVLEEIGLITTQTDVKVVEGKWSAKQFEEERKRGMEIAALFTGLEGLPGRFDPENAILGEYSDL
ncbi:hypothetical protein VTN77DRAFT_6931 [Rasamsonia byssochlamydoides]|uniref:uncharacterized protein n=1 Tax=Rasamsonia byssochlamydoides TaxID=89139 RepID=UPI003743D68E